ncbi:metallophosphoesterase [Allobacillus sp. SKP2-8]|uniref:metallophosphoesterase n=1 Tax=unclassified Allobacillus TaxID=2628859 RepID=UPI001181F352|nr:metallophosphoesterase [Allobacillus sp. SKP2-8]TSJ69386.1 metallophosphoesterase [Allobacillus sp. SKP2-8]
MNRRTFLKRSLIGTIGLAGAGYGGYYYAHEIEPRWVNIVRNDIKSERIPKSFEGFRLLQLTDTHIGFNYGMKELDDLIQTIGELDPDLILFTGDLIDDPSTISNQQYAKIIDKLSEIQARHGKYWIYGNHDHGGYGTEKIAQVMSSAGFQLLKNETTKIQKNEDYINLSGLDDILLGNPEITQLIDQSEQDRFNILLSHEPDFADTTKNFPFDVQLSGHSHGGQIQLPIIGYIITPILGEKYVEGSFTLGERPLQLFVSKGLGTTRLPFRFLCRPEINLYTLRKDDSK